MKRLMNSDRPQPKDMFMLINNIVLKTNLGTYT